LISAALLALSFPTAAQVTIGDNLNVTSSGSINAGYNDTYGNDIESSHGLGVGGTAAFNGYYYNPGFVSFSLNPYFNQSRNNSGFGSVTDASGVTLTSSIFTGSHFPGGINYSANFNNTGNYGIPGISSLNTNGNSQNFGINWGAFVPGLPSLSVGYQQGSNDYTLYGADENGSSHFRSFTLSSSYNLLGFGLTGAISHGDAEALIPGVVIGGQTATSNSDNTTYSFNVSHPLPWNGTFTSSFNRSDINSDYLGYSFNGAIDTAIATLNFHPTSKLNLVAAANYTDNLTGSLYGALIPGASGGLGSTGATSSSSGVVTNQSLTSGGSEVVGIEQNSNEESSHGLNFLFDTTYSFTRNFEIQGQFERREQSFAGESFGSNLYDAGLYYNRILGGGFLGTSFTVYDSTVDGSSQNQLGFTESTSYGRRIGAWQVNGYFTYVQNVQSYLVTYNTSSYTFSGSAGRKLGSTFFFNASAGGGRSGLTAVPGSSNSSESFSVNLGARKYAFGANYSKSDGNSLATSGGLVPTPLPPVIPTNLLIGYGGTSYSATASAAPKRHLNASFSYVKSKNNFDNIGIFSFNNYESENAYVQYQFRQLGMNGGWTHLVQGFSASGAPPARISSIYIGVYRWFNFF
jgi:hypothetical protein